MDLRYADGGLFNTEDCLRAFAVRIRTLDALAERIMASQVFREVPESVQALTQAVMSLRDDYERTERAILDRIA